jgi:cytochrome b subunit of formate dehydrogenase
MSREKDAMSTDLQIPLRFTIPQRIEHALLAVSFTVLGFTGLIQKYAAGSMANRLIEWLGGIEATRLIHRWAAAVFCLLGIYHLISLAYKIIVRRVEMTMMPVKKDFADAFRLIGYNLFLIRKPPQMPHYSFTEKLEYWALIWGGIIMAVTGFMLWNPLITTRFLPGQFVPAAKAAHGGEAVLAVLAIIVWHFYNVHFKSFNKSMFTGKLSMHQMEEEHGIDLSRILAGETDSMPAPQVRRRRMLLFIPVAVAIAVAGVGTVYWAATSETTAISTLPAIPHPGVTGPDKISASQAIRSKAIPAPLIPHQLEGRKKCKQCHSSSGMAPMPANHQGRPVESCLICHKPGPQPKPAKPEADAVKSSKPAAIPHSIEGDMYKDCTRCHGAGKFKPFPANHAGFSTGSCKACHKPAAEASQ